MSQDCQLVLLRHGESVWNKKNLFTGWCDVKLTETGEREAREAGRVLAADGFRFDMAYTSLQQRAIKTLWLALEEMDRMWIPVVKHWRLNERHYGKLQGKDKIEAVKQFGEAQVHAWRRSYAVPPPPVDLDSPEYPKADPRYADLTPAELPRGESLKDVLARVLPYWESTIVPSLAAGQQVLIAAHGNSLRALLMHLEGLSEAEIVAVNIPTGVPRAYRLNARFKCESARYLGEDVEKRIQAVEAQTKNG
ncbi:MAG TPA: 2,3-diphosphoglycerate-dependent phosphoglycerate mutase [Rhizomicrobium sp.]|nr:2,3-diphosphoglycerate-dependent phosphoglycerate mutase [Rhizomicrobium sp.]